jgi:hypothetical protein
MMMRSADAKHVEMDKMDRNVSAAGAFYFVRRPGVPGVAGIIFGCPCGCRARSILYLAGGGNGRHPEHSVVSGKWPKVTLSPEISVKYDLHGKPRKDGSAHWRGHLRDGVFVGELLPPERGLSDGQEQRHEQANGD